MEPNKDKEKDNKPLIPTLKDSAGKPQLKIKGVGQSGLSLVERLKQFKKKDLAFIMAGLGVLFMAPLAEHFMMAPEGANGDLFGPGISSRGSGTGAFGGSSSPYETGGSSMAPGSALGQNGDVITPLNVRDPSALVMGPGAQQQPPAGSSAAPTLPSEGGGKKESSDWKDALANAGASSAKAATKAAGLPVSKVPLSGGGLRGLGAISGGGGGGSFNAGPISAANVPNKSGGGSNMAGIKDGSNIKGVATRGPGSGAGGAAGTLRDLAAKQASDFNRSGQSAGSSLDQAANRNMNASESEGGASGASNGAGDKNGGNSSKDGKSVGESLEFLKQKAEQDHAIDLEWKLKEKAAMRWPNLEDKILEEAVMTPWKAVTGSIADSIKNFVKDSRGQMACIDPNSSKDSPSAINIEKSAIGDGRASCSPTSGGSEAGKAGSNYYWDPDANTKTAVRQCGTDKDMRCSDQKGKAADNKDKKETGDNNNLKPPQWNPSGDNGDSNKQCSSYADAITPKQGAAGFVAGEDKAAKNLAQATSAVNAAKAELAGDPKGAGPCANQPADNYKMAGGEKNLQSLLKDVRDDIYGKDGTYGNGATKDSPKSALSILENENTATKGVLVLLTDGKDKGPLGDADKDIRLAKDKAGRDAPYKALLKAFTDTQDKPSKELNDAITADKAVAAALTTADGKLENARKALAEINTLLDDAAKKGGDIPIQDPTKLALYQKYRDTLATDRAAAEKMRTDLSNALDYEKTAVADIEKNLHPADFDNKPGVKKTAADTKALVEPTNGAVKVLTDKAKAWAGTDDDVKTGTGAAYDTQADQTSGPVFPLLKQYFADQAKQLSGVKDNNEFLGIAGDKDKFTSAGANLNGETVK